MTALKQIWAAAAAGLLIAGTAAAQYPGSSTQPPTRAVYVTSQDGNSKVYYVTGTVPPEKLPTVVPAAPAAIPRTAAPSLPAQVRPQGVRQDAPAHPMSPPADAAPVASTDAAACASGHCGKGCNKGPTSFCVCAHTPATVPPPLGSSVRSVFDLQRDNALAEYFVVYREDWNFEDKNVLNDTGVRHVDGIVRRIGIVGALVKVEPTGNAALDEKHITTIVEKLVQAGVPVQEAGSRVVLGTTRAEGMRYTDIERLNSRGNGGNAGSGGYGGYGSFNSFGGFGAGGFGAGGFGAGGFGAGGFGGFR